MSLSLPQREDSTDDIKNAADDRLERRGLEQLLRGAISLDLGFSLEAEFAIMMSGRLGMRAGEIAHITEEWVDWRDSMIRVPRHYDCEKGKDGGVCGYCRNLAKGMIGSRDELGPEDLPEVEAAMWQPKTEAAARPIPFDQSVRVELVMERFFEHFGQWTLSRTGVNRRVAKAARAANGIDEADVYPHALRATAATGLASELTSIELQSMFGWEQIETAQKYVRISGERLKNSLG